MIGKNTPRILIVDEDVQTSRKLGNFLKDRGFQIRVAMDASGCRSFIKDWKPQFILYDLMLPEMNALQFLKEVSKKSIKLADDTSIFVLSNHSAPENVNACLHSGASDFLVKPLSNEDILSRLAFRMQKQKEVHEVSSETSNRGDYFLYLTERIMRKALDGRKSTSDLIFDLLHMEAMATHAVRCSLIETDVENMVGTVWRSSDDKNFTGFSIELQKYPEVTSVLQTGKVVALEDLSGNQIMSKVKKDFKKITFNSIVVAPVYVHDQIYGVVSARRKDNSPVLHDVDIRFCQIAAHLCGVLLQANNPFSLKSLKNSA